MSKEQPTIHWCNKTRSILQDPGSLCRSGGHLLTNSRSMVTCEKCADLLFKDYNLTGKLEESGRSIYTLRHNKKKVGEVTVVPPISSYCCFILNFGIHPDYRRKGLGSKLIRDVLRRHKPPIQVLVAPHCWAGETEPPITSEDLREFYASIGFEDVKDSSYMVWYPKVDHSQTITISVSNPVRGKLYIAKATGFEGINGQGRTFNHSIGDLVAKHQRFFRVTVDHQ